MAGSTFLDDLFMDYLKELVGRSEFEQWRKIHPEDYIKLRCKGWEEAKTAFNGTCPAAIDPPFSFIRAIPAEVTSLLTQHMFQPTRCPHDSLGKLACMRSC